jgi:hypothetical protein
VPTSPLGARTVSPTRIASGDPPGKLGVACPVARKTGLEVMADDAEDRDLRPTTLRLLCDVVERVGELTFVPNETRGRVNLVPPPNAAAGGADGRRPTGVGVEYMLF